MFVVLVKKILPTAIVSDKYVLKSVKHKGKYITLLLQLQIISKKNNARIAYRLHNLRLLLGDNNGL